MKWDVGNTICGIDELHRHSRSGATHAISILDPHAAAPHALSGFEGEGRLVLRFHDIILPERGKILPKPGHVELLLAFARRRRHRRRHTLVHCHAGISRSTAAAVVLLADDHPDADEDDVIAEIARLRPKAWPNSRMIRFADEIMGRDGRLVSALGRYYGATLRAEPDLAYRLRMAGRGAEVDMADFGKNVAPLRFFGMWRKSARQAVPAPAVAQRRYG